MKHVFAAFGLAIGLVLLSSAGWAADVTPEPTAPAKPPAATKPHVPTRHHIVTKRLKFDSAKLGKQVSVPVKVTTGPTVVERTGVQCKTGAHSCTNAEHTCADLASDMASCCGDASQVKSASCNEKKE